MKIQNLNGAWSYRIGKGSQTEVDVPFSRLAVGHSECRRSFDVECEDKRVFLKFDGITYAAKVYVNNHPVLEMLPYSEYEIEITDIVKPKDNELLVELEDISPKFGPSEGWENFGGIIRDVSLVYRNKDYITDVFFYSELSDGYTNAFFTVKTECESSNGTFVVYLYYGDDKIVSYEQTDTFKTVKLENVKLWSPEEPHLYNLKVELIHDEKILDVYECNVGFREFKCSKHRFMLNGKDLFIKGVCKHEMFGDSGHCPTEEQMLYDMKMIKETGCNFVRLVHYPHNKKLLDIADRIGLMVSEEPGLWWSDTADAEVANGSLEVLRRTIRRDKNHASIVFWLAFNECRFTEKYLKDSARVCRECDPTRLVSGANCMSNEDTLKYYNICGFDFYTMHPYSNTTERAKKSASILNDKPLLFTEWGGYFVYDNPHLLSDFINDFYGLYEKNSEDGALAGAVFWEWSELNDFNRGAPACEEGNLSEGLVDKYRNPTMIYSSFKKTLDSLGKTEYHGFWTENCKEDFSKINNLLDASCSCENELSEILSDINKTDMENWRILRKRILKNGPVLKNAGNLVDVPFIVNKNNLDITVGAASEKLCFYGMTSIRSGYPISGEYGEQAAVVKITYEDGTLCEYPLRNGVEFTTVFELLGSSRINPVAEKAGRVAEFGYCKDFERYVLNKLVLETDKEKKITNIAIVPTNDNYALLIYGISY